MYSSNTIIEAYGLSVKKVTMLIAVSLPILLLWGCGRRTDRPYPKRDISVYIFSEQGGATDTWIRQLSTLMSKELGVNLICASLPGAKGGTGAMKVWNSPHDGYTVLGASETSVFFGINDVAPMVDKWRFFIAGGSPGAIAVHQDSLYTSIEELAEDIRKRPGEIKMSNSGRGKLWHIKAVQLEKAMGSSFKHIPYNGSGPAITALLSREVDVVSCSCAEISEYVKAGLIRPLIVTDAVAKEFAGFGIVRSVVDVYPAMKAETEFLYQWLGFMLPYDVAPERLAVFEDAFQKVLATPQFEQFLEVQMARKIALCGGEADEFVMRMQGIASWTAYELGVARKSPDELGIPRTFGK